MGNQATKLVDIFKEKDYHIPTEEELQQAREIMNEKEQSLIQKKLDEITKAWMKQKLLCAVSGNTGTGKSSLINAIRDLTPMDEGAAAVNVNESTKEPTSYADPDNENLIYYDLPGVGTKKFPRETYLKDINLQRYDFYFIVTSCRFTENDIWLAEQVRKAKKEFYFIRTKIDQDIQNQKRDYNQDEETVRENIHEHTLKCLREDGFTYSKVYLISNYEKEKKDFPQLIEDVIKDLPDRKKEAMTLSIQGFSETLIMEKKKYLKRYVYLCAAASAAVAAVPVPGLSFGADFVIIMAEIEHYRRVFGLRGKDIKKSSIPEDLIKFIQTLSTKEGVLKLFGSYGLQAATEEVSRIIVPLLGSVISSTISFYTTYRMLNNILDNIADASLKLVKHKMEEKVKDMEM